MRFGLLVGIVMLAVMGTATASAGVIKAKTTLPWLLTPYNDPYEPQAQASLKGGTESPQTYCQQGRKIELFRDGEKLGSETGDKYGTWYMSVDPLVPGRYVVKTKKTRLPNGTICKAGQSKAVIVTAEMVAAVTG